MGESATYGQIVAYLDSLPAASPSWADSLFAAGLSMDSIVAFVATMAGDVESPLRRAEDGVLSKEIVRINQARGAPVPGLPSDGRFAYTLRAVLTAGEQARVVRLVRQFCQPTFDTSRRFGSNGHAVMNAVRRVLTAYTVSKVPLGVSVVEVGPDVNNWLFSPSPALWSGANLPNYKASRPTITPRDSVRTDWKQIFRALSMAREKKGDFADKASLLSKVRSEVFVDAKIQEGKALGEYILSHDSNYDIAFSDIPGTMAVCGARAWYGTLVRAKGLTRRTKKAQGELELMGANYRVDWKADRIDFRHRECSAFGYSHKASEYMKYEECNGYVWTAEDAHYVYSKGPETNEEILFFQVVRVPKVNRMIEPRFVENPEAGSVELTSIWAVGDEVDGIPKRFETVRFFADPLTFSKVLEKRIALDCKGDLSVTRNLVRSTNVRLWIHGTPVGANTRIESKLIEAAAVLVEACVADGRFTRNRLFSKAMERFSINLKRGNFLYRALETLFDLRAAAGFIIAPLAAVWSDVRASFANAALASVHDVDIGIRLVADHFQLPSEEIEATVPCASFAAGACKCLELADLRMAIPLCTSEYDRSTMRFYASQVAKANKCKSCDIDLGDIKPDDASDSGYESGDSIPTFASEGNVEEYTKNWKDEVNIDTPEYRSMNEFVELETYLARCQLVECRIDSSQIRKSGPISDRLLMEHNSSRTKHTVLQFLAGKVVKQYGEKVEEVGAIYDHLTDSIKPVRMNGQVITCPIADGFYYTCDRLKIWNSQAIISAVEYALAYGTVRSFRKNYSVTLGVPGAGKTYALMQQVFQMYSQDPTVNFVVLSTTVASVAAAIDYGIKFGIAEADLRGRICTIDSYLMNKKFPSKYLFMDEFPMIHIGKVDAAVAIANPDAVFLFGDALQIPYDSFSDFKVQYSRLAETVSEKNVTFKPMSHRLNADVCAMWLDVYPAIYPCECCEHQSKTTVGWTRVSAITDVPYTGHDRIHTYKQDEMEDVKAALLISGTKRELRAMKNAGICSVHEDQGSTHASVVTIRSNVVYDKNAAKMYPSLYNRDRYVLTDTTRHTKSYHYYTMCDENDGIIKRVSLASDPVRHEMIRNRVGYGIVSVKDMLM